MKLSYSLFCFGLLLPFALSSQIEKEKIHGIFYKISLATTLTINEDYEAFDDESNQTLIQPSALFVNNTIGYQFDNRTSVGFNFEYNWHSEQGLHFFPAYLSLQHNFIANEGSNVFIRGGYGTLLSLGKSIEKGNVYKLGIGIEEVYFDNALILGLGFTRKRFGYRALEGLTSISIFIEIKLF